MLPFKNDFTRFDKLDWLAKIEVDIRFLVELLAYIYDKAPDQIIEILCQSSTELPRLRYEDQESDDSTDPQWLLFRYFTVLNEKVLLSRTLESSSWGMIQSSSLSCREDIKFKNANYPSTPKEDLIYQSEGGTEGSGSFIRIVKAPYFVPFDECWAYRQEVEKYLSTARAFEDWFDRLIDRSRVSRPPQTTDAAPSTNKPESAEWAFLQLNAEFWSIGPKNEPKILKHMDGFSVIRSGLQCPNTELSLVEIKHAPRPFYIADDVSLPGAKQTIEGTLYEGLSSFVDEDDGYSYAEHLTPMQAIDVPTYRKAIHEVDIEISGIDSNLVMCQDEEACERLREKRRHFVEQRTDMQLHLDKETRPDGQSRIINDGDDIIREGERLRQAVARAIQTLHDNELNDLAAHLKAYFKISPIKKFAVYRPIPDSEPEWLLDDS